MPSSASSAPGAELVERHLDYASALARQIHAKLPAHVDFAELEQYARLGLVEAANKFDPARGAQFTTFAYYRIRGAVFDGLRRMTGVPHSVFARAASQALSDEALSEVLEGAEACHDEELMATLFESAVAQAGFVQLLTDLGEEGGFELPDARESDDEVEREDALSRLRELLAELEPQERELVDWLYAQSLSMSECGARLGLDKAQISRRHARILGRLRAHLASN